MAAHLIYFAIIVVVVSNAVDALNIIPNGAAKFRCVDIRFIGHREISQIVCSPEFQIQQMADIVVQAIDQREAMIIPRVILHTKRAWHILSAASRKILICKQRIFDKMIDILGYFRDWLFDGVGQLVRLWRNTKFDKIFFQDVFFFFLNSSYDLRLFTDQDICKWLTWTLNL